MSAHRRIALLSVSDKRGLADFAAGLERLGFEVVSTGGTHQALAEQGIKVKPVSEITGFPEILDGRVKTLHPRIHGAILADRAKDAHLAQLEEHAIAPIELVVGVGAFADALARVAPGDGRAVGGADPASAWDAVRSRLRGDAVILLKGSRGVRLERLVPLISDWASAAT